MYVKGKNHAMNKPSRTVSTPRSLPSTIAGSWYPGTADALDAAIGASLARVPDAPAGAPPNVLLLPHAGYAYSLQTAAYGIKRLLGAPFTRVVLLAPSHRVALRNAWAAPEADAVATPYGSIPIDHEAIDAIARGMPLLRGDAVHAGEHSTQIQYPLLQVALKAFTLVPLIVGDMDRAALERAAVALAPLMDRETLLLVSSDFTHYGEDFGYAPFREAVRDQVEQVDLDAFALIRDLNVDGFIDYVRQKQTTICGHNPIAVMLRLLPPGTRLEKLHYATSSDESNDYSRFVCYLALAGWAEWSVAAPESAGGDFLSRAEKRLLLRWAREAIRHALDPRRPAPPARFVKEATANLSRKTGCFVTLKSKPRDQLRGCIGEITARRPLYQAVPELAIQSAFNDPRFPELCPAELDGITIEISVLTPERPVASWRDIEIGRHGMTLSKRGRLAVFLPRVASEQGWTLEETLTHLAMKAGLGPDEWRTGASFTVFEAIVFGEKDEHGN
jgi:MEMO1 family protein